MSKKRSFSPVPGGAVAASQQMAVQQIAFAGKFSVLARPKGLGFAYHEEIRGAAHGPPVSPVPPVRPADSPPARGPARGLSSLKTCHRHVFFTLRSEVRVPSLNKKTGSSLLRTSCFGAPEGTRLRLPRRDTRCGTWTACFARSPGKARGLPACAGPRSRALFAKNVPPARFLHAQIGGSSPFLE